MSMFNELSYDKDIDTVKSIRFCLRSPEETIRMSVVEITKPEPYSANIPVPNGLFDERMGVLDYNRRCLTCQCNNIMCPGHFGHIKLAKPVFYIQYFPNVMRLLKCVCFMCSSLLVDEEVVMATMKKHHSRQARWNAMLKLNSKSVKRRCPKCFAKQPFRITKEPIARVSMQWQADAKDLTEATEAKEMMKQEFSAEDVLNIFTRISDRDSEMLGYHPKFSRPEWMICTVLTVPPPAVRPSVKAETGARSEDDLTHKLMEIIKADRSLQQKLVKDAPQSTIEIAIQLLQYNVATFIDNNIPGVSPSMQRTGRPLKSISERLKSKEGRLRGNLMGKRVDFSARSVITPDPNLSIDEVGVPFKIAMNLTFPEVVNEYNVDRLTAMVRNGPDKYPGAKFVRIGKFTTILRNMVGRESMELSHGSVVERHLCNGDYILFNRQPSLHKMSMMGHRVRVMKYHTFRMHPFACQPYNADFDGDEMNLHLSQSITTMNEIMELTAVPHNIMSLRSGKPIISIVQDVTTALYLMTKPDVVIREKQMMNMMANNTMSDGTMPKGMDQRNRTWTGRQALSTIIPDNVNLSMSKDAVGGDEDIVVVDGEIKSGTFTKETYQSQSTGLVHSIMSDSGANAAREFFDNTSRILCNWLTGNGFSVGLSDLVVVDESTEEIKKIVETMKANVHNVILKVHSREFKNDSIMDNHELFELEVNKILNGGLDKTGKTLRSQLDDKHNRMMNMIKSGAKGNDINISQMIACLGQVNVDGKRIKYGFDNRTLPHFQKYDDGPDSRGFIDKSFIHGLSPHQFYHHAQGGREGLIDTAVKTSDTGYLQRKLVKAMEDCKVHYDYTVRSATGAIIQFLYGEDGMDAAKIEVQHLPYIRMTYEQLREAYYLSQEDIDGTSLDSIVNREVLGRLRDTAEYKESDFQAYFDRIMEDRRYVIEEMFDGLDENTVYYPISFRRIINVASGMMRKYDSGGNNDLSPKFVLDRIGELCTELYVNSRSPGNRLLHILIRCFLCPKDMVKKYGLNRVAFSFVVDQIRIKFMDGLVNPGEMVGVIAAQSIGEPCTQLTLNTFHLSGVSSASKGIRGVPRIKELLSVTRNMKAPSLTIHVKREFVENKTKCQEIMASIEITYVSDILRHSHIFYDPESDLTNIEDDQSLIDSYKVFMQEIRDSEREKVVLPCILRLEFDREKMHNRGVTMMDVYAALQGRYDETIVNAMFSDDNANKLIMRVSMFREKKDSDFITDLKAIEKNIIENLIVKGMKNIDKIVMQQQPAQMYDADAMRFNAISEWVLETNGSNLIEVFAHPDVDYTRTVSNDIHEINKVLGIEAARQALYNELQSVLKEARVNFRHLSLLVDMMTNRGALLSIDRHGINRSDIGPLAKCSFEEVNDMLINAAMFSETDRMTGLSANLMLGQIPGCGTGDTAILVDEDMLIRTSVPADIDSAQPPQDTMHDIDFDFVLPP